MARFTYVHSQDLANCEEPKEGVEVVDISFELARKGKRC